MLNDNDIRGAKWILININSAEGEHEFTMDEVEIIQNYLLAQAGEGTDVILGMGYDNTLGDKIGITLIATGFEHKDPFDKVKPKKTEPQKDEKIVLTLEQPIEQKINHAVEQKAQQAAGTEVAKAAELRPLAPAQEEVKPVSYDEPPLREELSPKLMEDSRETFQSNGKENNSETIKDDNTIEWVLSSNSSVSAAQEDTLSRPSNIYAEPEQGNSQPEPVKEPVHQVSKDPAPEEEPSPAMQLIMKDEVPTAAEESGAHQTTEIVTANNAAAEEPALQDEAEIQKRRAAERIQKLRNLSFNINAADPNNEFETVPAYIRRNLDLYNSVSHVENFYSNYEVKADDRNKTQISTINTFLDGKKPD